ncbi:hypothetical protein [Nocardia fluminea]|uniref:Uncharacterized protein n=1 Tax=Nocardia fluminea TaxID=134984 RepID=A0A2N3V4K2_9NOCA|nr:hypothetical protein [Nocardia fluminea]PKV76557.1 hypothetical protein ATK86_7489 [Nocardia fluminea]
MTTTTATHTHQAPGPDASRRTIDHATDCPFAWCVATGLPDEHDSLCEPYTPATLSLAALATDRGTTYPAAGFGVCWDRSEAAHEPAAIVLHIVGPRDDCEADFTLSEAITLRAQLDRAIGIATGLRS